MRCEEHKGAVKKNTETEVYGADWTVTRSGGRAAAELLSGAHGGRTLACDILIDDFERIKASPEKGTAILDA
jgi:hypothetical protein